MSNAAMKTGIWTSTPKALRNGKSGLTPCWRYTARVRRWASSPRKSRLTSTSSGSSSLCIRSTSRCQRSARVVSGHISTLTDSDSNRMATPQLPTSRCQPASRRRSPKPSSRSQSQSPGNSRPSSTGSTAIRRCCLDGPGIEDEVQEGAVAAAGRDAEPWPIRRSWSVPPPSDHRPRPRAAAPRSDSVRPPTPRRDHHTAAPRRLTVAWPARCDRTASTPS